MSDKYFTVPICAKYGKFVFITIGINWNVVIITYIIISCHTFMQDPHMLSEIDAGEGIYIQIERVIK